MRYLIPLLLLSTAALADEAPKPSPEPTVTLTRAELQAVIASESAKAVATYITQQEAGKAKGAYDKIGAAFAPKPPAPAPEEVKK